MFSEINYAIFKMVSRITKKPAAVPAVTTAAAVSAAATTGSGTNVTTPTASTTNTVNTPEANAGTPEPSATTAATGWTKYFPYLLAAGVGLYLFTAGAE